MGRTAAGSQEELHSRHHDVLAGVPDDVADDVGRTHALWRRAVAAGMAALFAFSLVLIGLVCTARAAEPAHAIFFGKQLKDSGS